jgi:DNA repair protein REV1
MSGLDSSQDFWEEAIALEPPPAPAPATRDEGPYASASRRRYVLSPDTSDGSSPLRPARSSAPPGSSASPLPDTTVSVSFLHSALRSGPITGAQAYLAGDEYRPTAFGDIGDYMRKKDLKVQTQNRQLAASAAGLPQIFAGVSFYINGNTTPGMEVLRRMIVQRGGVVQPYLRTKGSIDYVVAPVLTLAKFKDLNKGGGVRIVREGFVTRSCEEGRVVDWRKWRLVAQEEGGLAGFMREGKATIPEEEEEEEEEQEQEQKPPVASSSRLPMVPPRAASGLLAPVAQRGRLSQRPSQRPSQRAPPPSRPVKAEPRPASPKATIPVTEVPRLVNLKQLHQQSSTSSVGAAYTSLEAANSSQTDFGEMIDLADVDLAELEKGAAEARAAQEDAPQPEEPEVSEIETTDPKPNEGAWEHYALHKSNPHAARLMQTDGFRETKTAVQGTAFIDSFYQNSRLHLLSTWKAALKLLVSEARSMAGHVPRVLPPAGAERVLMHADFDAFFVSAGLATRPHLRGKPVVVCHSRGGRDSTSEIASASYEARARGIRNGMSLGRARQLCPEVETIPYDFETYKAHSTAFYAVLLTYADELEAVSIDEALLDITGAVTAVALAPDAAGADPDPAVTVAGRIRAEILEKTGCTVSVGIAHNILLARLATRRAKPPGPGIFHLTPPGIPAFLSALDVDSFPSFGHSAKRKLSDAFGGTSVAALLPHSKESLRRVLGPKTGDTLYNFLRGRDDRRLEPDKARKSVSAEINYAIRFADQSEADAYILNLALEVSKRLQSIGARGRHLTLKIMARDPAAPVEPPKFLGHGRCETFNKSSPLARHTDSAETIGAECLKLLHAMRLDPVELRGIGIQVTKLEFGSELAGGQPTISFRRTPKVEEGQRGLAAMLRPVPKPAEEDAEDAEEQRQPSPALVSATPSPTPTAPPSPSPARGHPSSELDAELLAAIPPELHADARAQFRASKRRREAAAEPEAEPAPAPKRQLNPAAHITKQLRPRLKTQLRAGEIAELPLYSAWGRAGRGPSRPASRAGSAIPDDVEVIDVDAEVGGHAVRELRALGIDPDVFAALPADVQADVVAQGRARRPVVRPAKRVVRERAAPVVCVPPRPALFGERSTAGVAGVLAKWVQSGPPAGRDVERVRAYLLKCLAGLGGIEHVSALLRSMRALGVEGEWAEVWEALRAAVDEGVRERMGAGLRL